MSYKIRILMLLSILVISLLLEYTEGFYTEQEIKDILSKNEKVQQIISSATTTTTTK